MDRKLDSHHGFHGGYYSVLGINASATEEDIRRAYRDLVKKVHPDANREKSGAELRKLEVVFRRIQEAYDVLGDPQARIEYDRSQGVRVSPAFFSHPRIKRISIRLRPVILLLPLLFGLFIAWLLWHLITS